MTSRPPTQRLADLLLGQSLDDFVLSRRAEERSWRLIARDLYERTNGQVDVTHETLRSWYGDAKAVAS
jgi:hypothetical protein